MLNTINSVSGQQQLTLDYVLNQLINDKLITQQQRNQFLSISREHDASKHPLIILANQNWQAAVNPPYPLNLEELTRWLAKKVSQEYIKIDPLKIDVAKITGVVSQAYASKLKILPIDVSDTQITVATCEPFIDHWENELSKIANLSIKRVLINPKDLERYLVEFFGVSRSILGAVSDKSGETLSKITNFEQLIEVGKMGEPDANDRHVVSIVDWLLQFAFEQRASDIHLEPRRQQGKVRFRIDGVMHNVHEFPEIILNAITSRLKSLGRMDVTDRRRPQDGRIKTKSPAGKEIEMRLSTMPTAFGEKMVLRIFDPDMLYKNFQQLGFTKHDQQLWHNMTEKPHGIILVTGPTGSGKTTTLYSSLRILAKPELNVCTIEDPIEMVDPTLNQMQVQQNINVDFATGVKTLLRQDPDIIMIGEIRDKETADMAIQAALTGHLVLSTLHTNDAPSAITRLIDIGVQPFLISATLLGVLAQRLVRTLCPHCKQPTKLDENAWHQFCHPLKIKVPNNACKPVGCDECRHTGYKGRTGIYEAFTLNKTMKKLVSDKTELIPLRNAALKDGMRSLRYSGAHKVAEGLTTLEELYTVLPIHEE